MGRKKAAANCKIPFWMSARADCKENRFLQVGNSLLLSEQVRGLSAGAFKLYVCMAMEAAGKPEFTFPKRTMKKYGISHSSGCRQIRELRDRGLLEYVYSGQVTRADNRYRFCLTWKTADPKRDSVKTSLAPNQDSADE